MYKQLIDPITNEVKVGSILRTADMAYIPFDPANTDAKEFAKWLSKGGVPEAAVEGKQVTQEWINQTIALLLPAENT